MKLKTLAVAATAAVAMSAGSAMAAGSADAGKKVFKRCMACHTIKEGGAPKIGPNLYGAFGSKCGSSDKFSYGGGYKAACDKAGWTWNEDTLMTYLKAPSKFLSDKAGKQVRSKMTFKLPGKKDRQNVIAYLKSKK